MTFSLCMPNHTQGVELSSEKNSPTAAYIAFHAINERHTNISLVNELAFCETLQIQA